MASNVAGKIKEINDGQKIELIYEMNGKTTQGTPGNTPTIPLDAFKKDLEALANKYASGPVKLRIRVTIEEPSKRA